MMKIKNSTADLYLKALAFCLGAFVCGSYAADTAHYDTTWTFVYDGGKTTSGKVIPDKFRDVKILPTGEAICVGQTVDSTEGDNVLLIKLSATGKALEKRLYTMTVGIGGNSLLLAKNGDYLVGGYKYSSPFLLRLDPGFNKKFSTWYYDSTLHKPILARSTTINSMVETKNGHILATAGDVFPNNNGSRLNNYAALLQYDSLGVVKSAREWLNTTGYELAGWSLTPSEAGGYMLGGNQSVFLLDTLGLLKQKVNYSFTLPGVGSVINNVKRVHQLRSGMVMVAGQSYEEDCWTRYKRFSYDAWWSPLGLTGNDDYRYTAGVSGADDVIYDFTQLVNGNIVFVGNRQSFDQVGGIWAIVTDSMGKNILWQKQFRIPYRTANGAAVDGYSVAASPDSGFTVVGPYFLHDSLGGTNAFAAHFVPKPVPASILNRTALHLRRSIAEKNWTFTFNTPSATDARLELFTLQGKRMARIKRHFSQAGQGEIQVDASAFKTGAYMWQLRVGGHYMQGISTFTQWI